MENRIPVPTDNIFKFYALSGLVLVVFCFGTVLYINGTTNGLIISTAVEIDTLRHLEKPTRAELVRLDALERQKEIAIADRKFLQWPLGGLLVVGGYAMWYGFRRWHLHVQPILDETAKVQLEIAKLQLEKLRREVNPVSQSLETEP